MEAKKLEAQIHEWSTGLGFAFQDGSAPPSHYFSMLTATPHRRQLWKAIIESVQDRRKIEKMRKQLFVHQMKQGMKGVAHQIQSKSFPSKIQLHNHQKELQSQIKDQSRENYNLEKKILAKASDLLFDAWKLTEIEEESNKYKEKALALRLMNGQQNIHMQHLEMHLVKSNQPSCTGGIELEQDLSEARNELAETKTCSDSNDGWFLQCRHGESKKEGSSGKMWEKAVQEKREELQQLSAFLQELGSIQKNLLRKENEDVEGEFRRAIEKFKQEICLKALQVMLNDSEAGLKNLKVRKLLARVATLLSKSGDRSIIEDSSYLLEEEMGSSFPGRSESLIELKNQVNCLRLKSYQDFLEKALLRIDNEALRKRQKSGIERRGKEEFDRNLSAMRNVVEEIEKSVSEQEKQIKEIARLLEKTKDLSLEMERHSNDVKFIEGVRESVEKVKVNCLEQIKLFMEIPLEALKATDHSREKERSAFEVLFSGLGPNGGELKRIFQKLLINPFKSVEDILKEMKNRKLTVEQLEKLIEEKKKLLESFEVTLEKVNSLKHDPEKWEKLNENCQNMLSKILAKTKELELEKELVEKVLINWASQPYRNMIDQTETVFGKTLKEYERLYEERKKEGK